MYIRQDNTLVGNIALNKALTVIYNDLRKKIDINSIGNSFCFASNIELIPEYNMLKRYPLTKFKMLSDKDGSIVPATFENIRCAGMIPLINISTMELLALGNIKEATSADVEMSWVPYLSNLSQLVSTDINNSINFGSDKKLYLDSTGLENTDNKNHTIDDINIVKIFKTYLDFNPEEIKKIPNVKDGQYIIILKDQLHRDESWLYVLSNTSTPCPGITPVAQYTNIDQYPSVIAVKEYINSSTAKNAIVYDDTMSSSNNIWGVALDKYTIKKNKEDKYAIDLDVIKDEILLVPSTENNITMFNANGYIKDAGWSITEGSDNIDVASKKIISKEFLVNQIINQDDINELVKLIK